MNLTYIETPATGNDSNLIIRFTTEDTGTVFVHVFAYGTDKYTVKITDADGAPIEGIACYTAHEFFGNETFGRALAWAEPITIAHLVHDFIRNQ